MRANSGSHFETGSSSDSLPSSRSFRIARAVKLFVMEAMRNAVPAVMGASEERSRMPTDSTCASRPSITMPQTMPGIFLSAAYWRKIWSIPETRSRASGFSRDQ